MTKCEARNGDRCGEAALGLVVTSCGTVELLDHFDQTLDGVTSLVEMDVPI